MSARFVGTRRLVPAPLRKHLTKTGDQKRKYAPEAAMSKAKRDHKEAYECTICGFWHIGGNAPKRPA